MSEETVSTRTEWNEGEFDKTSADRNNESGNLGVGYVNGGFSGVTTQNINMNIFYRMDDDLGSSSTDDSVIDFSGNNENGETKGGIDTNVNGVFGTGGFSFDGSDTFVDIGDKTIDSPQSVSVWFKTTVSDERGNIYSSDPDRLSDDTGSSYIAFNYEPGTGGATSGSIGLRFTDDDGERFDAFADLGSELYDGNWHHLVIGWDLSSESIIVVFDGNELSTTVDVDTGFSPDFVRPMVIGMGRVSGDERGDYYDGELSEWILFDEKLSLSDVETLYFDGHENDNFEGSYKSKELDELDGESEELTIDASVSSGETLTATVVALDSEGDEIDTSDEIDVQDGENTYDVENLSEGDSYRVDFDMEVDQ